MTREERDELEASLASSEESRDASAAELAGYQRAERWAEAFGDTAAEDRAIDLVSEAEENVRYYTRQADDARDAIATADAGDDHRAFERDCGARS